MHARGLHAHQYNTTCAHSIPLGGSGSSVTSVVPPSLGSTFSQSDSGVLSDALMAAELSSYFCLLVARFSSWFSASQQINSCVVAVEYRGLYLGSALCTEASSFLDRPCSCHVQTPSSFRDS